MESYLMDNNLKGRVVFVTGAGKGFGRLICQKVVLSGAKVFATDVDSEALQSLKDELATHGDAVATHQLDVTDRAAFAAAVKVAADQYAGVDILINNAGIMPLAFMADHEQAAAAWDRCIDINLKGVLNGVMAVYDPMIAAGRGHIVNLASIYGNYPTAGSAVYGATKAAVSFMSEALRQETGGKIKVSNIRPTGVPATALGESVVNSAAAVGIMGANAGEYLNTYAKGLVGDLPAEEMDSNSIRYWAIKPEELVEQVIYVINQPWGINISDITVRASADAYVV